MICTPKVGLNNQLTKVQIFYDQIQHSFKQQVIEFDLQNGKDRSRTLRHFQLAEITLKRWINQLIIVKSIVYPYLVRSKITYLNLNLT